MITAGAVVVLGIGGITVGVVNHNNNVHAQQVAKTKAHEAKVKADKKAKAEQLVKEKEAAQQKQVTALLATATKNPTDASIKAVNDAIAKLTDQKEKTKDADLVKGLNNRLALIKKAQAAVKEYQTHATDANKQKTAQAAINALTDKNDASVKAQLQKLFDESNKQAQDAAKSAQAKQQSSQETQKANVANTSNQQTAQNTQENNSNSSDNSTSLTESISGNDVKLKAGTGVKHGNVKNAIQLKNIDGDIPDGYTPYFIYSTDGDHTGDKSQSVIATKDPYQAMANLNVNIIGLGETTLLKHDADTNSTDTQGEAQLTGSVWGLYKAGTNTLVKYSDGQNGYPITVTNGEKVDDKQVQLKLTDLTKGVGVKNLDNSSDYEWGEVKAPEGYELSTKRYKVHFDDKDKFDDKTSNYIDDVTALDRVLQFHFGFIKAQDVNGSYTGLNGRVFRLTPQGNTKGEPIEVTSGQSEDASGFINNGQVNFPNIKFGDYLIEELPQDNDKLQLINPISVTTNTNKDKDGNITGYTVEFKDTVTQQVITTLDVPISKTTDNNTMFKVNLGTLVDKPVTPVVPTIKTQAHSKDGDKIIQINEVSEKTPIYDIADFTNVLKGDQILSYVHRVVTDKDGKVTSDKLLQTLKYVADDETVKTQQHRFDTTVDTTKDFDIPDGSKVIYVFTEKDFDASANPETDEPKAKHDDLKDQDQTLTVDKVTPSIDVEKANAKVPDAGNGNHTDKDNNVGQSSGEKDLDFMMRDGKMLAEPQLLNKSVNLDQVKQVLAEYGMQFHIKELENGEKELHFFAKDANVCANALDKAMEDISKNPEKATQPSFESEVKVSKQKEAEEIKAKQAEKQKVQEANKTVESNQNPTVRGGTVDATIENPFEGGIDIGE
ncbi:hypothetical protein GE061_018673 [Apolygus lucorum]|uniref:Uncharacterized protein n=1 Tax=Apolygus lucorum TaxID=248454 RepID=A0A8S9XEE4_APOLU|nr:hypothetical protein GE061_018673 [Apolygus lucorum]